MTEDLSQAELSPAQYAGRIEEARERMLEFIRECAVDQWTSAPVDGDPRRVGVIVDHVSDAYAYIGGWISELQAGQAVHVDGDVVDQLNAAHAAGVGPISPADAAAHLRSRGDELIALIAGLTPEQLRIADGLVARMANIAAVHADGHREEIAAALAAPPVQ